MIPKIIHFCWMSGEPYPDLIQECLDSWKEKLPDYKVIKWDCSNFDYTKFPYANEAMSKKKYAFVSDIVRLYALYNYGGIYLDSDIKVLKSFDDLLRNSAFTGFESNNRLGVWLLGSEKHNPFFEELLRCYAGRHFLLDNGEMDLTPNPVILGAVFDRHGIKYNNKFQQLDNITVYPQDYFCPLNGSTGELNITENSYAIHLFNGAWRNKKDILLSKAYQNAYQSLPNCLANVVKDKISKSYAAYKVGGMRLFIQKAGGFIEKKIGGDGK